MNYYLFSNRYYAALLFVFLSVVLLPKYMNANVLQGRHIIDLMMKNYRGIDTLLITQRMTIHHAGTEESSVELTSTLRYRFPEDFRSDTVSVNAKKIHIISKGNVLTAINNKITAEAENVFDYYKDIILYNSRLRLEDRLSKLGLDVSVSSIGRLNGKIAFVIGAQYPELSVSQLWVDKQNFMPMRLILTNNIFQQTETFLDIRYLEWKQSDKVWYPMRIEFYQNNVLVRVIIVDSIETNPFFSEDIFDIDQIRSGFKSNIPDLPEPEAGLNKAWEPFEEFKKIY